MSGPETGAVCFVSCQVLSSHLLGMRGAHGLVKHVVQCHAHLAPVSQLCDTSKCSPGWQGMDAYEFAEPVEVAKQLDKAFWEGLSAAKWQDRRDALQRLRGITASPRLAPGDFGDVLREMKKILAKDSNVVCVAETIGCIGQHMLQHMWRASHALAIARYAIKLLLVLGMCICLCSFCLMKA